MRGWIIKICRKVSDLFELLSFEGEKVDVFVNSKFIFDRGQIYITVYIFSDNFIIEDLLSQTPLEKGVVLRLD